MMIIRVTALFLTASLAASLANAGQPDARCGVLLSNWSALHAVPESSRSRPVNVLSVQQGGLRWNGTPVTEDQAGEYLRVLTLMTPGWLMVLAADPGADCTTVTRIRDAINSTLHCTRESCGELNQSIH